MMDPHSFKILVTDDEESIRHFLRVSLSAYQHTVLEAENGDQAIGKTFQHRPDLLVLDLGLPDMDGVDVIREVREFSQVPIIVLSVRNREEDKISALDAGADDYLSKPFGIGELLARIRGVMRRVDAPPQETTYQAGGLKLDTKRHQVTMDGNELALTPTEFEILKILMQNAGRVLTHFQIASKVWGYQTGEETRLLRVNISNLRRKIEPDLNHLTYIRTELGVGYRFLDED